VLAEGAVSENGGDQGNAARVEFRHAGEKLSLQALWGQSDTDFENPSSSLQQGRAETAVNARYALLPGTSLRGELLRSEDRSLGARREGAFAGVEQRLSERFTLDVGVRQSRDEGGPVNAGAAGISNIALGQAFTPYMINAPEVRAATEFADFTAWHVAAKAQVNDKSRLFAEVEQDVEDSSKSRYALGADYRIADRARLYARHEDLASTSGPYGLTSDDRSTSSTLVGLDTSYLENGQLFSELRLRDAMVGREAHAAYGLRQLWAPRDGLRLTGGFERQQAVSGTSETATALSGGAEFSHNPLWRATSRLELRRDSEYDAVLSTVGYAHKINRDWSLIVRNYLNWVETREGSSDNFLQDRLQVGFAFRQADTNVWSALGRYERLWERDRISVTDSRRTVDILSAHASMHPTRTLWLSGRLAAKWVDEEVDGAADRFDGYLAGIRVTHDLTKRWDIGFASQWLYEPRRDAVQYSLGPEVGFLMAENLWISLGYNFSGFEDRDLAAMEYTSGGAYLRFRFKFDEDVFGRGRAGIDPSVRPAAARGD
jgi:large repetitive protein